MLITKSLVKETSYLSKNVILQKIHSPEIASVIKPGEFLNIKVSESTTPLLRRPFSICDVDGEDIFIMFNIVGEGTRILSQKKEGELLDILGPLGKGFNLNDDYDLAIIAAGGLGSAPFPFLTKAIRETKEIKTFVGGRSEDDVITFGMMNVLTSTDDGSEGIKGTVVDLLQNNVDEFVNRKVKVFGCGPTPMLKALKDFSLEYNFTCEISTECAMACGFGICMGCPIESTRAKDEFLLVCKDGPVFNAKDVIL